MKNSFICFADSRLKNSSARLLKQAKKMEIFDSVKDFSELNLTNDFKVKFSDKLVIGTRGYGYWVWKPEIILNELLLMEDGEILLYMDAGSHLNKKGKDRLSQYFEMARDDASGILAFDTSYPLESVMGRYTERHLWDAHIHQNFKFIKADALDYFGVLNDDNFLRSPIIEAGHIIICKNNNSISLLKEWLDTAYHDFSLFDDSKSKIPNLSGFIEHRHDQAIFSILGRKYGIRTVSNAETWYPSVEDNAIPDWSLLQNFPIHAKRDKDYGLKVRITNLILKNTIGKFIKN